MLKVTQVLALELVRGYHVPAPEFHTLSLDNALFLGVTLCIAGCWVTLLSSACLMPVRCQSDAYLMPV